MTQLEIVHVILYKGGTFCGMVKKIYHFLRPMLTNHIFKIQFGLAKGFKIKGELGLSILYRKPTAEELILKSLNLQGKTVYDVGGYIGITSMFFSRNVGDSGHVITFEPLPDNFSKILENISINNISNVRAINKGVGQHKETKEMAVWPSCTAMASIDDSIKSKILSQYGCYEVEIEIDSIDNVISLNNLPKPDFIKIDVEGYEFSVLLGMKQTIQKYKPDLFIEIHGSDIEAKIQNAKQVAEFLINQDYKLFHVETGNEIKLEDTMIMKEGHVYCS